MTKIASQVKRTSRGLRTRFKLKQQAARNNRLRLNIFRSNSHVYAQIIDDKEGKTLVAASTMDKKIRKNIKSAASANAAITVGKEVATRAVKAGITEVYFDRGGFKFAGRIKALADAARDNGLKF